MMIKTPQGKKKQQVGEREDLIAGIIHSVQEYNITIDET